MNYLTGIYIPTGETFSISQQRNGKVTLFDGKNSKDVDAAEVELIEPELTPGQIKLLRSIQEGLSNAELDMYYCKMEHNGVNIPNYPRRVSQTRLLELLSLGLLKFKHIQHNPYEEDFIITQLGQKILEKYFPEAVA